MGCDQPFEVVLESCPSTDPVRPEQHYVSGAVRWIYIHTPCRRCPRCLANRQKLWRKRAMYEYKRAPRTWFLTLTIAPEWRFRFSLMAGSTDYHASYGIISKEMTKYWKRLRKAGYKFRYLMVAESHKDGYPHIHALVNEVSAPIPKRELQAQWPYGLTNVKLVEDVKAAMYITKYMAKDMRTRVRASQHYGAEVSVGDPLQFLDVLCKNALRL
jgi:hypothetical protein